jgi:hypothetical protein
MKMKLTTGEINHLLMLIERNLEDNIHTRPERQYWRRTFRLKARLIATKGKP